MIFHSRVTDFAKDVDDSGLSIKMVMEGCEAYKIGNTQHQVRSGHFLLVNEHQQFECRVHSAHDVEGLCLYLDPTTVSEIHQTTQIGHRPLLDKGGEVQENTPPFLEKVYTLSENRLGKFLQATTPILRNPQACQEFDFQTFFIQLSENLVFSQNEVRQQLRQLQLERSSTREEIFRRVSLARNFIDANYLNPLSLDELASTACLSKYHFMRCFKQVYQRSPYQYVLQRRLEKGKYLLRNTKATLTEIAFQTGFTDRRAFNKAFRKAEGLNPAAYRQHS